MATSTGQPHKYACSLCARRKVRCDKGEPCSNCLKAQAECRYEGPVPPRPRKRAADEDLLARLAQYEGLMRKHNVDFSQYANQWVPSGMEVKVDHADQVTAFVVTRNDHSDSRNITSKGIKADSILCFWSTLSPELKYPSIQCLTCKEDQLAQSSLSLESILHADQPDLRELHPEPRTIFRLWQSFVEYVNPFTKIVHVPTLQQRVLDASWDPSKASRSLTALLFAIYTTAIASMGSVDCLVNFDESRDKLLARYRSAALRALVAAEFLTTRDLEVMQAFVLFLLADPGSDLTSSLAGAAIRLCQKMGMDREDVVPKRSAFVKEMHIRMWWQIRSLDYRNRTTYKLGTTPSPLLECGYVRLPLNVNDVDLHPDMSELPIEHEGPTEMLCVLMKLEVFNSIRASSTATKVYDGIIRSSKIDKMSLELEDNAIDELEARYEEKFFRKWDKNIPLHALTRNIANLVIARLRFKVRHPRRRFNPGGTAVCITQEESDMLFDSTLNALEALHVVRSAESFSHVFPHMTAGFELDGYIYLLSDLRRRSLGTRVDLAWSLVEIFFNDHPDLINISDDAFYSALGDLAMQAWEARRKELIRTRGGQETEFTPKFVLLLWGRRESVKSQHAQMSEFPELNGFDTFELMHDNMSNWECWGDLLGL